MGIGLDFGLQNGPTLTTPDDARRAYDQGQLIGSAVGMAADIVAIGAGLSIPWSGELPALLGGLIGSVFGPEGTASGALVGTVISVPALIAGLGLTSVGAGLLPGHTSLLDDAVDNLRRMEADGSGAGLTDSITYGDSATSKFLSWGALDDSCPEAACQYSSS